MSLFEPSTLAVCATLSLRRKATKSLRLAATLVIAVLFVANIPQANAVLTKSDFLTSGDGFIITDTSTGLEWLTPFYTRNHSFNDGFVQDITTTYGFRYATAAEVTSMVDSNFDSPTTTYDAAGFTSAEKFFDVFGVNEYMTCGYVPCPRTQGLTSDIGSNIGTHLGFGMIQYGSNGRFIVNNPWSDSSRDPQMGSWLVHTAPIPEPESYAMLLAGLSLLGFVARRRNKKEAAAT